MNTEPCCSVWLNIMEESLKLVTENGQVKISAPLSVLLRCIGIRAHTLVGLEGNKHANLSTGSTCLLCVCEGTFWGLGFVASSSDSQCAQ